MSEERVRIAKKEGELVITIKAFSDGGKQKILLLWIVLFSLCGIAIISQFFGNYDNGTKVFFGAYVAFWLFFEFKVIYAYRWRKYGMERIIVDKENLTLIKEIGQRGITQKYPLNEIRNLGVFVNKDSNFVKSITSSYWNINKYTLAFDYEENTIPFAIDLSPKDVKLVLKEFKDYLKKKVNND
ncbi:MAG: hypothetical protein J5I47_11995 [Vicingus serpentipes]|nr:hypothetical protein [Vicingus serpentipes]